MVNPKRPRTARGSSSANPNPAAEHDEVLPLPPLQFRDADQVARYEALRRRTFTPTRYLDLSFIRKLGLRRDFNFMLSNVGWAYFATIAERVYPALVLEFLSSLSSEIITGVNCELGLISFRMFNNDHSLTLAEFCNIYQFPHGGDRRTPRSFHATRFWSDLTGEYQWRAGKCNSSSFRHPLIRIMHRFIASTILGRGDSEGKVRLTDLLLLWAMVERRDEPIDSGAYLARHFQAIANTDAGLIVNGGLVTTIAIHLGYRNWVEQLDALEGTRSIGLPTLQAMQCITADDNNNYYFVVSQTGAHYRLPAPQYSIRHGELMFPLQPPTPSADEGHEGQADEEEEAGAGEHIPHDSPVHEEPPLQTELPSIDNFHLMAALRGIENRLQEMDERQQHYHHMVDQMYNWHLRRYPDDFPPQ